MIPKGKINKLDYCCMCGKSMSGLTLRYYIWANKLNSISGKVVFHKECFKKMAGSQWLLEGY